MPFRIITISRQFGSGGRTIGRRLAKELDIPFFDRRIIEELAKKCGFTKAYVESHSEYESGSALDYVPLSADGLHLHGQIITPNDRILKEQYELISSLAAKGPCIIVGRAADYILRERTDVLNVFIHADNESRIRRIVDLYHGVESDNEAAKQIIKHDRDRKRHYRYYTGRNWGDADLYHITLNSGRLGEDNCVSIIRQLYEK